MLFNFTFSCHLCSGLSQQPVGSRQKRSLDVSSAWATLGNSEFPVNRNVDVFGLRAEKKKKTIDPSSEA